MALADKFLTAQPPKFGLPCGVGELIKVLPNDELDIFLRIMAEPSTSKTRLSNRKIHRILLDEGHDVSFSSISLHRRKVCRCYTGKDATFGQETK